ncbi:MAG: cardiolipin synthase [Holophaga sp.]|nr:cardiolipin synthase [Holophaga sp.]
MGCLLVSACARLPDVRHPESPVNVPTVPSLVNAQGKLSDKDAAVVLARRLGPSKLTAQALAGLEEAATGRPLIAGNRVTLLFDGPRTIAAMMAAVAGAEDTVNLETYLFDQDPLGMAFADLLIAKQRAGVQVCIIYDCVGTLGTPQTFFDRMEQAGIRLLPFHPVSPFRQIGRWRINNRDHRKILVVDGKIAFTGGVNITAAYSRSSLFRSSAKHPASVGWRDTHLQIEGPAVATLQWMFLNTWGHQKGAKLSDRDYYPPLQNVGNKVLRVVASRPGSDFEIYRAYLLAIGGATKSIHITAAYFVPDREILKALMGAARRGVDVKLILPSVSDSGPVFYAGHSFYTRMLKGGIQVHELRTSVMHAKTAVIDGAWSTVGSTNLDMRSFLHNTEVNLVVLGDDFGQEMESAFREDLRGSDEITLEHWKRRSIGQRCKEWLSRLISYWL